MQQWQLTLYAWKPLCYPCIQIENFLRFQVQDKHNASSNFSMSWKEFPQSSSKDTQLLLSGKTFAKKIN